VLSSAAMGRVLDLAEKLWTGAATTLDLHPFTEILGLEEIDEGVAFVSSFANVGAVETGEGLVLLDAGSLFMAGTVHEQIRAWTPTRVSHAVFTHGHVDHAMGLGPFEAEGAIEVIAHEAIVARFDRYQLTRGYNGVINRRQFQIEVDWPKHYRYPDRTYRDRMVLEVGGLRFELFHDKGETDDHTWCWIPEKKLLATGDLFIWASPNCGNPQKVQRFPREWAAALRKMEALGASILFPGHGPPIVGADRVRRALSETAALLESLFEQTLAAMNAGARLDEVLHTVRAPSELIERPYLRPIYDEPEFVVRNLWRLYGGWYDGNPARLKPPRDAAVAAEVASLAGGAHALAARAEELCKGREHAMACQLIEWAAQASPDDAGIAALRTTIYRRRAEGESSLMARAIFNGVE